MGGKTNQSTQSVTVPPAVLAQYSAVNARANQTANTPFQQYSTDPNAFVAPINATQQGGISQTTASANEAQPYYSAALGQLNAAQAATSPYYNAATSAVNGAQSTGNALAGSALASLGSGQTAANTLQGAASGNYGSAYSGAQPYNTQAASGTAAALAGAQPYQIGATGAALAGAGAVNPTDLNSAAIGKYLSPYLQTVLGSESALLNQNNQQQQAGQLGNAITSGAFGGDRAGIAAANLEQQQNLANANIYGNILNTGYNNALSTAQQQQGVGLAAGQANRAALQGLAPELQSIGQQGYGQQLSAAQEQAAIGQQIYGQGMGLGTAQQGLGQQVYGQGATTAAQQAALGQQQFGQGLAASQQQAQLGQDIYGTGAATSAATAGLGAGAQSAALQGAQAQLQAGTAQQQTEQAGKTALYNQFLQQQSYPFQVDQFLANIAEGTGALSGSTTTTTQPGGLFSDERLKEDIQPVGKTFDGQNIIRFRYKGDKKTQLGLSAQETEKHHPDAVGLAQGYKTVDYDKATERAANQGHFADGGLAMPRRAYAYGGEPLPPGVSPDYISAILQAQQQMYAPFSQAGGLYGGQSSGAPRGGSSYVPQASLPVSHLAVAGGLPTQQPSGLSQVAGLASNQNIQKGLASLGSWAKGRHDAAQEPSGSPLGSFDISPVNDNPDPSLLDTDVPYAGGGLATRRHRDTGGPVDLYGQGLDIPNDQQQHQLAVAGALPKKDGSGALGDIAAIGGDIAKFIPFLASGGSVGRKGYDDGGPVDPTGNYESGLQQVSDLLRTIGQKNAAFDARYPMPTAASVPTPPPVTPAATGEVGVGLRGADYGGASPANPSVRPISRPMGGIDRGGGGGGTADNTPPPSISAALEGAPSGAGLAGRLPVVPDHSIAPPSALASAPTTPVEQPAPPLNPAEAQGNVGAGLGMGRGFGKPMDTTQFGSMTAPTAMAGADQTAQPGHHPLSGVGHGVEGALGKVGDQIKGYFGDPRNIPSFLTGLAAMVAAPTKYPLVALTQGLGAGAQSYMQTQQQRATIAETQAQAASQLATASGTTAAAQMNFYKLKLAGALRPDPNGPIVDPQTGQHYSANDEGATAPAGVGAGANPASYSYLGKSGLQSAQGEQANFGRAMTLNPGLIPASNDLRKTVFDAATTAQNNISTLDEQTSALLADKEGVLKQGALAGISEPAVAFYDSLVSDMGHPDWSIKGLGPTQVAAKLQQAQAFAQVAVGGDRAYAALMSAMGVTPGAQLDRNAALTLMAQMRMQAVKDIDRRSYFNEYAKVSPNYLSQDVNSAFDADHPPAQYNAERLAFQSVMNSPAYGAMRADLQVPGTPAYERAVKTLDVLGDQHGIHHFSRYMTGVSR